MRAVLLALTLGVLAGLAGRQALDQVGSARKGASERAREGNTSASMKPCAPSLDRVGAQSELDAVALELAELVARQRRLEGDAIPWPDDLPPKLEASTFEGSIAELVAGANTPMGIVDVDCTEYPCIAVVDALEWSRAGEVGSGPADEIKGAVYQDPDLTGALVFDKTIAAFDEGGQYHRVVTAVWYGEPEGHEALRLRLRMAQIADRFRQPEASH